MSGSLLVLSSFQVHVAQYYVDGEHDFLGIYSFGIPRIGSTCVDITVSRNAIAAILLHFASQRIADLLKVFLLLHLVSLRDTGHWFSIERHRAIGLGKLHVSPGTDGVSLYILWHTHVAATRVQLGITMCNEVIAVIDNTVVNVSRIVLVGHGGGEVSQLLQVGFGIRISSHQVATHLIDQHILVGSLLNGLENTQRVEHGVGFLVERRIENLTV